MIPVRLFGGDAGLLTVPLDSKLSHVGAQNARVVSCRIYKQCSQMHIRAKRERNLDSRIAIVRYRAPVRGDNALFLFGE